MNLWSNRGNRLGKLLQCRPRWAPSLTQKTWELKGPRFDCYIKMLGWRPYKGESDQRFLQGDLIQIHVWGQIDRDLTYPTKKGKGKSSTQKCLGIEYVTSLREYPIHFLSHPRIWMETAETAIGHWWQPSEAAKHQPFPARFEAATEKWLKSLMIWFLGPEVLAGFNTRGIQHVKSWRKKLGDLYFNPVIQTRIVNDSYCYITSICNPWFFKHLM